MDFWLLALGGIPALAVVLGACAIHRRPGSRGFAWCGAILMAIGGLEVVLVAAYFSSDCIDSGGSCEGAVIAAPAVGFAAAALGSLAMSITLLLTRGWYGPGGTREKPKPPAR